MINEKLKAAREERGWTITKRSQYLEISHSGYKGWEAGRSRPNKRNLNRLCALLKKTPEELGFAEVNE